MRRAGESALGALLFAAALTACGDKVAPRCAPGTKPDPSHAAACVPDGSVICGNGTIYDEESGTCIPGGCPRGQVLISGTCTANVTPDAEEAAEPNDAASAGTIPLPAAGAPGYVVHGCVTPHPGLSSDLVADNDPWLITVTGQTLLDITIAGVGGLAAAFAVTLKNDNDPPDPLIFWQRGGVNLVDSTSHRQIFLPEAGTYQIIPGDSRSFLNISAPAGSANGCYFMTVKQLELPTPTIFPGTDSVSGNIRDEVRFFRLPVTSDGELVFAALQFDSAFAAVPSLLEQRGGTIAHIDTGMGLIFGTKASDEIVLVVDNAYNYALGPVNFTLVALRKAASGLSNGQPSTVVQGDGVLDDISQDLSYFWFDAEAGDFIHLKLDFSDSANFLIINSDFDEVYTGTVKQIFVDINPGLDSSALKTTAFQGWYYFPHANRYYVAVYDPALQPHATMQMTSKLVKMRPERITIGAQGTSHALGASNGAWFTLDPTEQQGIVVTTSGSHVSGNLQVDYYPVDHLRNGADLILNGGLADVDFKANFQQIFPSVSTETRGHLTLGDPTKYLVRVSQSGTGQVDSEAQFTFDVAPQTFVELGTINQVTSADKPGEDLGGTGQTKLYLVQGNKGDTVMITIHPTAGLTPTVKWLDLNEEPLRYSTAAGAETTLKATMNPKNYVAFSVTGGGTTTYDVHVATAPPVDYTMTPGTLPYTDICNNGGNQLPLQLLPGSAANGEAVSNRQTMPFEFSLFDALVKTYTVESDGFLTFNRVNSENDLVYEPLLPTEGAADGVVAPYWYGLADVVVCKTEEENQVTVQWNGVVFGVSDRVQTQVVMHKDGSIDFIWGPGHRGDGSFITIGLENIFGTFGKQFTGRVRPSTSLTFTPMP